MLCLFTVRQVIPIIRSNDTSGTPDVNLSGRKKRSIDEAVDEPYVGDPTIWTPPEQARRTYRAAKRVRKEVSHFMVMSKTKDIYCLSSCVPLVKLMCTSSAMILISQWHTSSICIVLLLESAFNLSTQTALVPNIVASLSIVSSFNGTLHETMKRIYISVTSNTASTVFFLFRQYHILSSLY